MEKTFLEFEDDYHSRKKLEEELKKISPLTISVFKYLVSKKIKFSFDYFTWYSGRLFPQVKNRKTSLLINANDDLKEQKITWIHEIYHLRFGAMRFDDSLIEKVIDELAEKFYKEHKREIDLLYARTYHQGASKFYRQHKNLIDYINSIVLFKK